MAVKVDKNLYFNMNKTDADGNFGVWEEGYRDPTTHTIVFGEPAEATDAARDKAVELGVDVNSVEGTGSGGKVTVQDVEAEAAS